MALFFRPCCCCEDFSPNIDKGSEAAALPEPNPLNLFTFVALVEFDPAAEAEGSLPLLWLLLVFPWNAENADDGTALLPPLGVAVDGPLNVWDGPHFEEQPAFGGIAPEVGDNPKVGWFKWPALGAAPAIEGKNGEWPYL